MSSIQNADDHIRPGNLLRIYANDREITYRADRVDRRARVVEGSMLDDCGALITGFMMSFEAWESTAERSKA